jgi:hypothetical protein
LWGHLHANVIGRDPAEPFSDRDAGLGISRLFDLAVDFERNVNGDAVAPSGDTVGISPWF